MPRLSWSGLVLAFVQNRLPQTHSSPRLSGISRALRSATARDVAGVIALRKAARLAQLYPHLQVIVIGAGRRAEVLSDRAAR